MTRARAAGAGSAARSPGWTLRALLRRVVGRGWRAARRVAADAGDAADVVLLVCGQHGSAMTGLTPEMSDYQAQLLARREARQVIREAESILRGQSRAEPRYDR